MEQLELVVAEGGIRCGKVRTARFRVKNVETGNERKLITDSAGRYSAPSLAIGRYQVSVEKTGPRPTIRRWCLLAYY